MATTTTRPRQTFLHLQTSEFWSGDLGLILVTISLVVLVFVITPLREAGLPGRLVFDLIILSLMVFGTLALEHSRVAKLLVVAVVLVTAAFLAAGRFHPTPLLHRLGSVLSTITLVLYVRSVRMLRQSHIDTTLIYTHMDAERNDAQGRMLERMNLARQIQ